MEGVILDDMEEEEDTPWSNQISGRNCVLFLIDARKNMFSDIDGSSYFKQSIVCCKDAMLDIAKKQRGDMIGVVLYGTQVTEGKYAPDNVAILQELMVPSVSIIKKFNEMIEDNFQSLREKYGDVQNADLTRAINYCQIIIHLCKRKLYVKNIVMMTCDDNPCGDDERAAFRARKQATELYLHKLEFEVVSFGKGFDSNKLFKELVLTSKGELLKDWEKKDPILKIEDIQNQIGKLTQKFTRRLSFLRIGTDKDCHVIQVSLFKLYNEPRKFLTAIKEKVKSNVSDPAAVSKIENLKINVDDDDDLFLQADVMIQDPLPSTDKQKETLPSGSTTNVQDDSFGDDDEQEQEVELQPVVAGKFLEITKAELRKRICAKTLKLKRGFQIIGFVLTADVPLFYTTGEPYFVLPFGRDRYNRMAFSHLLFKCRQRGVSMVGWFCLTKSASPTLTIVHPLKASAEGNGHPCGFLLVRVPFSDDFFEVDGAESSVDHKPTKKQQEAAKQIVSKLTLPYEVGMFNDAEYNSRTAMIESIAMDYAVVPAIEDSTDIDLDEVEEMLGELNSLFISDDNSSAYSSTLGKANKRSAVNPKTEVPTKHRKLIDSIDMVQKGKADKLTVAELREVLKSEGVKSLSSMAKPLLVEIAKRRFCSDSQ